MNRTQLEVTLALHGWVPITERAIPKTWGFSHAEHGSVYEDRWHKTMGPSTAPLQAIASTIHEHEPYKITEWSDIPTNSFDRLVKHLQEEGWLT